MKYEFDERNGYFQRSGGFRLGYSDGQEVEFRLENIVRNATDRSTSSLELLGKITDWPTEYHLSRTRHCLLRPLAIKPGDRVLEVGCGCGALTRYLGEMGATTTALEGSPVRARIAALRCAGLPGVDIYVDDLLDFEATVRFDWVLLIGVLEYAPVYGRSNDPVADYLQSALRWLADDGKLVLAIENKLGLKYWNGCTEDHLGRRYVGIEGGYRPQEPVTFGRRELQQILTRAGLSSQRFYYPFPDYKLPSVILTETGLSDPELDVADMLLRNYAPDYTGIPFRNFDDALALDQLARNQLLGDMSNSFLVVGSRDLVGALPESRLALAFAANRVPEFASETTFERVDGKVQVSKREMFSTGTRTRLLPWGASLSNLTGSKPYVPGRQILWSVVRSRANAAAQDRLSDLLSPWLRYLLSHSSPVDGMLTSPMPLSALWLDPQFIDCSPFNILESGGRFYPIDQEWDCDQGVPLGWIVTRSLLYCLTAGVPSARRLQPLFEVLSELCTQNSLAVSQKDVEVWLHKEVEFQLVVTGRTPQVSQPEVKSGEYRRFDDEIDSLHAEAQELCREKDALFQEKDALFREKEALFREKDELWRQRNQLHGETDAQRGELERLKLTVAEVSELLRNAQGANVNLRAELESAVNSRSWKLTRPLRWLNQLRRRSSSVAELPEATCADTPACEPETVLADRESWDVEGVRRLSALLDSDRNLSFIKVPDTVEVSVILVFYNKAHLSLMCLESILSNADVSCELIIVDNASTDRTAQLLDRIEGATIIRNETNLGFAGACVQGAASAKGKYLCFLNNDALIEPGCLSAAVDVMMTDPSVGAVGGKILFANGRLQEAGSILWSDGSALGYGRNEDPGLPQFEFRRAVDYCSGALLLTPKSLFDELGGFDPIFHPAYYEDTDYCSAIWERGLRVIYEPRAVIRHYESASHGSNDAAKPLMAAHQTKFQEKWRPVLETHLPPAPGNVIRARIAARAEAVRILYLDDRIPHRHLGSGFPRSNDVVNHLSTSGYQVTCASLSFVVEELDYSDFRREVEFLDLASSSDRLGEYMEQADIVWVSRPHNMEAVLKHLMARPCQVDCRVVYDAEALFTARDRLHAVMQGRTIRDKVAEACLQRELDLARAADAVVAVSHSEAERFSSAGIQNIHVIGHQFAVDPTAAAYAERDTFLFIGAMHGLQNPNADSMVFFCREIWPQIHHRTGAHLIVAGYGTENLQPSLESSSISVIGGQEDLRTLYNHARVFVVPTRYAAGIPYKAHEAAAHGVPLVVSEVIADQLGWRSGEECFVAKTRDEFVDLCCQLYRDGERWVRVRRAALERIRQDLSPGQFAHSIDQVLGSLRPLFRKGRLNSPRPASLP